MKWPDYKGHKVFCDCNASFLTDVCEKRLTPTVEYDYPEYGKDFVICSDCRLSPWYYIHKKDEPKSKEAGSHDR
jgi:hypothetical protein